jgi:hypothetical protein
VGETVNWWGAKRPRLHGAPAEEDGVPVDGRGPLGPCLLKLPLAPLKRSW